MRMDCVHPTVGWPSPAHAGAVVPRPSIGPCPGTSPGASSHRARALGRVAVPAHPGHR